MGRSDCDLLFVANNGISLSLSTCLSIRVCVLLSCAIYVRYVNELSSDTPTEDGETYDYSGEQLQTCDLIARACVKSSGGI